MQRATVHVVGSINLDLILQTPRIPSPGETVLAASMRRSPGGKGANQAVAAATAGARTRLIGCVGGDDAGEQVLRSLRSRDVNVDGVRRHPGPTGLAVVTVDGRGENAIVVSAGANARVDAVMVEEELAAVGVGDVVVVQGEVPPEAVEAVAARCRAKRARLVLNLAPVIPLDLARLRPDVLVVNEHEARLVAGRLAPESHQLPRIAAALVDRYAAAVVITLGERGALCARPGRLERVEAPPVEAVIDTTGAGDAFVGALAAALCSGEEMVTAVRSGVAAGAVAVQHHGAQVATATDNAMW